MELVPESIQGNNTLGLEHTFRERLIALGSERLGIDFANETDLTKLSLWLYQFGIPPELLPQDADELALRDLLQLITRIYSISGTATSIQMLATALGAEHAEVLGNSFVLDHNLQALHNTMFRYDAGKEYRAFAVDITVFRVFALRLTDYEAALRKLFKLFQPVHLFLRNVIFE